MLTITPSQERILHALAQYKFLTPSLMVLLGIQKHRNNINASLLKIRKRKRPLIDCIEGGVAPTIGRLENMYFLTTWGKLILTKEKGEDPSTIKMPSPGSTKFSSDYFHRLYTIHFMISIDQYSASNNIDILYFDSYFDKQGSNRKNGSLRAKSRVDLPNSGYIIPDGIFMANHPHLGYKLFAYEMYNGRDTKRVIRQLHKHVEALSTGAMAKVAERRIQSITRNTNFSFQKSWRVLCVFEHVNIMLATLDRVKENAYFQYFEQHIIFKAKSDINSADLASNWLSFNRNTVDLF